MRVLMISPKFHPVIGGGETYVLNLMNRLHAAGVDVAIAVEPHPERQLADYPYPVFEVAGLSDNNMQLIEAVGNMYALLEKFAPDLIHVHGYFALLVVGLTNSRQRPLIATIHSTPVWGERVVGGMGSFQAELQFARQVLELARPQRLTAANEVYASVAKRIAGDRSKVVAAPYPVDIDLFHNEQDTGFRKVFGLGQNDKLIMTPSRVIERKGIREIIGALEQLPENFYLCLPGAFEPLDEDYWQKIQKSKVYQKIKHRIIVPERKLLYEDMPQLYAASDIIAMPSYYEGAPVATVEAMASGKPFVGADSQGINSFIMHQQNGLLVPKQSINELAEAILSLTADPDLQVRLTRQAYQDILHLSWTLQLDDLLELYREVLADK